MVMLSAAYIFTMGPPSGNVKSCDLSAPCEVCRRPRSGLEGPRCGRAVAASASVPMSGFHFKGRYRRPGMTFLGRWEKIFLPQKQRSNGYSTD